MDLADFLLARIAEDEASARAATQGTARYPRWTAKQNERMEEGCRCLSCYELIPGSWDVYPIDGPDCPDHDCFHTMTIGEADARHIARWDPARVLAECDVKRRIAEEAVASDHGFERPEPWGFGVMRLLALPYADHPAYDETWRP